jgi:hypothetical protein
MFEISFEQQKPERSRFKRRENKGSKERLGKIEIMLKPNLSTQLIPLVLVLFLVVSHRSIPIGSPQAMLD